MDFTIAYKLIVANTFFQKEKTPIMFKSENNKLQIDIWSGRGIENFIKIVRSFIEKT